MGEHTTLATVSGFVDGGVGGVGIFGCWEGGIEFAFLDVGVEAVDFVKGGLCVDGDGVGAEANEFA